MVVGAKTSANRYSLAETCEANNIGPYRYLLWLFTRSPLVITADDYTAPLLWDVQSEPDVPPVPSAAPKITYDSRKTMSGRSSIKLADTWLGHQ
ncbi:transposase domain-containing protein [Paraburkholderia bengalensis]|uniref:transposase domain-containing protein n=1 Tax=Paraburkholderia bengalensis TaxID=2747562 RepID=UPI003AF856FB